MQHKQEYIDSPAPGKQSNVLFIICLLIFVSAVAVYGYKMGGVGNNSAQSLVFSVEKTDGAWPKKPFLPDISGITVEAVEAKVPAFERGILLYDNITLYPEFRKFMEGDAPRRLRLAQHKVNPRALVVVKGSYNWAMFYDHIHANDPNGEVIQKEEDGIFTLHVPLLVLEGASLVISGDDVKELRLSRQSNAYLVNAGKFFIIRTKVVGWNDELSAPTAFVNKKDYRPFITNWDGGNLYLAGSEFVSLGYLKGKSYGISFSACTPCAKISSGKAPSTGIVVGNKFIDLFYGFYSYEAEDVAIVGNVYDHNVIYAIDPHDRSRRLIIAKNETYNTHKKHGIIISREVNDSWIFDNYSHHNAGSGIMLDRTSVNNVVVNNLVEYNDQDGITFFESEDNVTWGNTIRYNKKNGIRIRNSWNVELYNDDIYANNGASIEVYSADISGQGTRDFELDPYTERANAVVVGAKISSSGASIFKVKQAEYLSISNVNVRSVTKLFPGPSVHDKAFLMDSISRLDTVLKVTSPGVVSVVGE